MPDLLNLPNELLSKTINYIQPSDIESFAESCTLIAAVAEDKLQLHFERKKRYSHLDLYGCHRHEETHSAVAFLVSLCQDDDLAYYPVSINVDCCEAGSQEPSDRSNIFEHVGITDPDCSVLLQKLDQTAYVDDDLAPKILEALSKADQGGIFGTLLILLSNLELISLDQRNWRIDSNILYEIFRKILNFEDGIRKGTQPTTCGALKRLDEVYFTAGEMRFSCNTEGLYPESDVLSFFARIPSVRSFNSLNSTCALYQFYEPTKKLSNLENLTLEACCNHFIEIDHSLSGFKALKRFSYNRGGIRFDYVKIAALMVSLCMHTRSSLESLSITGCDGTSRNDLANHTDPTLCYFNAFECLKDLKIPCNLYTIPNISSHKNRNPGSRIKCLAESNKVEPEWVQRLTYILPPSLVRLEMEGPVDTCTVALFLEGLAENKVQKHPHLRWITFRCIDDKDDNATRLIAMRLRRSCSDVGIHLDLY